MDKSGDYVFDFSGRRKFSVHYAADPNYKPVPSRLVLGDAYPNPTSQITKIPVLLPERDQPYELELSIFDIQGKKVATIASGKFEAGLYHFDWMPVENQELTGGMYFYRLSLGDAQPGTMQKKLIFRK